MSSAVIGNLRVNLGMDSAEFQTGARKAQGALSGLSASFKAFASAALAALSFGAVTSALKSAVDQMDALGKAAQRIGIPVEQLSGLEFAARLAGVSLGDLEANLSKFNKALGQIAGGKDNDASAALKAIGVSATDAAGKLRPTNEIIADIAGKFADYKDGAEKAALAQALFGKAGSQMIPLLNAGKEGLAQANAEAQRFGLLVGNDAAAAAQQFNDNLTRMEAAGQGLMQVLAGALLPALADLGDKLLSYIEIGERAGETTTFLQNAFRAVTDSVMKEAAEIEKIGIVWTAVSNVFTGKTGILGPLGEIRKMQAEIARVNAGLETSLALNSQIVNLTGKGSLPYKPKITAPVISTSVPGGMIKPPGKKEATEIKEVGASLYDSLIPGLQEAQVAADKLNNSFGEAIQNTLGSWIDAAIDGTFDLKDALGGLLSQITKLAANSALTQLLGNLFGGAGSLYDSSGGGGILGGLFNFASGGTILPGGSGGIDSQLVMFRKSPNERVDISKPGQALGGGGGGVSVQIIDQRRNAPPVEQQQDNRGNLRIMIRDEVNGVIGSGAADGSMARFGARPARVRR